MLNQNLTPKDASFHSLDAKVLGGRLKQALLDLFYPVNTLYLTDDENFNPNSAWGGTWEQLDGGYALMTTKKNYPYEWSNAAMDLIPNMNKEKVYEMSTYHADSHIPGTNVEGGIPNITGTFRAAGYENSDGVSGAIRKTNYSNLTLVTSGGSRLQAITFDASRCATAYGLYQKAVGENGRVIPDHHATIVWKRIA